MNILIDIGHPSDVHFFRYAVRAWESHGHRVSLTARRIPIVERLLKSCGFSYDIVSEKRSGVVGLAVELLEHAARLYPLLRRRKIDVCLAVGGTFTVHAGCLARCRRIVCYDTDTAKTANRITFPFASSIVTPACYPDDLGRRHVRYRGIKELAYLHPDRFTPDPAVPAKVGLAPGEPFSVMRLISWQASHDIGLRVPSLEEKRRLLRALEPRGRVIIVPEGDVPPDFHYACQPVAPEDFHSLLHHASWCVTEGASTAAEACVLGTPTLYLNPLRPCYIGALAKYGLLEASAPGEDMVSALERLDRRYPDRAAARRAAETIVADHCDVSSFLIEYVENLDA
jgi:predicted glycosyltransferase